MIGDLGSGSLSWLKGVAQDVTRIGGFFLINMNGAVGFFLGYCTILTEWMLSCAST